MNFSSLHAQNKFIHDLIYIASKLVHVVERGRAKGGGVNLVVNLLSRHLDVHRLLEY